MKHWIRAVAVLLCTALLLTTAAAVPAQQRVQEAAAGLSALGGKAGTMLRDAEGFPAGTSSCDWAVIALALAGAEEYFDAYQDALRQHVEQAYADTGCLDARKATEYHRVILTVLALGGDPTSFGTRPDGTAIDLVADGTYRYSGGNLGGQGLNGWIWALIALDASGVESAPDATVSRQDMLQTIVLAQEPDGGFGLIAGSSDVDITAMALQALAPCRAQYATQIEAALDYLAAMLNETCGYSSYGYENAESVAQVVLALCALGLDPETESRFVRGAHTLLTKLVSFQREDGSFTHLAEAETGDLLASAQSTLALIAVQRLREGESAVFCFADYAGPRQRAQEPVSIMTYVLPGAAALLLIGVGLVCSIRKRRKHG